MNIGERLAIGTAIGVPDEVHFHADGFKFFGRDLFPYADDAQSLGTSTHRWKNVWATNGTIQTSDLRFKKDVTALPYGLREVLQLRPVTYEWKNHPGERHLGLIAQETQRVLPEAVVTGSDRPRPSA